MKSYTPAYSYPKITPGYLPPPVPKLAISTPTAVTLNSAAYAAPAVVTKYAPAITATTGYNAYTGYNAHGSYGSVYDTSLYAKGGYYSNSAAKILSPPAYTNQYLSTPAIAQTAYAVTPTATPVVCKYICSSLCLCHIALCANKLN